MCVCVCVCVYTLALHHSTTIAYFMKCDKVLLHNLAKGKKKNLNFKLITQMVPKISTCEKSQFRIVLKSPLTTQGLPALFNIQQSPLLCFVSH